MTIKIFSNPYLYNSWLWDRYIEQEQEKQYKQEYLCEWNSINYNDVLVNKAKELSVFWNDENNNNINKAEEKQNMKQCEFQLGDIVVVKDEFENVFDGEAILAIPGYDEDNFIINKGNKGVAITVFKLCDNCGELDEAEEFTFDYNGYYEVEDVVCEVHNGLLTLQVYYNMDGNIEINKDTEVEESKEENIDKVKEQ
jgi:hypothetical protein